MKLTPRQSEIVEYIRQYVDVHRVAPTQAEIGMWCGISQQGATKHLDRLVALGVLSRLQDGHRAIRLTDQCPRGLSKDNLAPSPNPK